MDPVHLTRRAARGRTAFQVVIRLIEGAGFPQTRWNGARQDHFVALIGTPAAELEMFRVD